MLQIRSVVSGRRARFKDRELGFNLDLVYITDKLIVMGFPATGLESFYRNKRGDVKKFLDHKHGDNYWVFNFCPLIENSYDSTLFYGRVSRYPFPDHHAPPLPLLALAVHGIRGWLQGSPERVAVLHCKAGKGRSGTVACAYLLSLDGSPEPSRLRRSYTAKQWAKLRSEDWTNFVDTEVMDPSSSVPISTTRTPMGEGIVPLVEPRLETVLALHTARRMKPPSSGSSRTNKKYTQGVSIPSQRRFLLYWYQILSNAAPASFYAPTPLASPERQKVKLTQITIRLRESRGVKMSLVKVADVLLGEAARRRSGSVRDTHRRTTTQLWVSLARYDDDFVEPLEIFERRTRVSQRRVGNEFDDNAIDRVFDDGKWDKDKMVRTFSGFRCVDDDVCLRWGKEGGIYTHVLRPLKECKHENTKNCAQHMEEIPVVLDGMREVRAKIYLGRVLLGWFWFIPTFHMSDGVVGKLRLERNDVDFPGTWIVDLDFELEWVSLSGGKYEPHMKKDLLGYEKESS